MKRLLPVDVASVSRYGVDRWKEDYSWPVSDKEFLCLCLDLDDCYSRLARTLPDDAADILLISRDLFVGYWHFLHALKVVHTLSKEGKEPLFSENSPWYKEILAGEDAPRPRRKTAPSGFYSRCKSAASRAVRSCAYNRDFLKLIRGACAGKNAVLNAAAGPLIKSYIRGLPYWVFLDYPATWLFPDRTDRLPKEMLNSVRKLAASLFNELSVIATKNGIHLNGTHIRYLSVMTERGLGDAARLSFAARVKTGKRHISHLLACGLGSPLTRALCLAVRHTGGHVISFSHGGHIGLYNTPTLKFSEFALSDELITYSRPSIRLFEKIQGAGERIRGAGSIRVNAVEYHDYRELNRREGGKVPEKVRRVMVIGCPYTPWRKYHMSPSLSLSYLHLDLCIVDCLRKAGFEVAYKAHPDRISEAKAVFEGRVQLITDGLFEDYLEMADAFVLGSIRTTAFPIALCTGKPVLAFMMRSEYFSPFPEAMELLKRRCRIVYGDLDERNRMVFDEKEFLDCLCREPRQPDKTFIEEYLFPGAASNA